MFCLLGQDAVEIIGSPNTISLLSRFVDQVEDRTTVPIPDAANNPVASSFTQDGEYGTSQVPPVSIPAASLKDVQIVDLQLTSEKYIDNIIFTFYAIGQENLVYQNASTNIC